MIYIYILFIFSVVVSFFVTLITTIALLGKALGFAFDEDWKIYKARRLIRFKNRKNEDW